MNAGRSLRRQRLVSKGIFGAFARTSLLHKTILVDLRGEILENHLNQWLA